MFYFSTLQSRVAQGFLPSYRVTHHHGLRTQAVYPFAPLDYPTAKVEIEQGFHSVCFQIALNIVVDIALKVGKILYVPGMGLNDGVPPANALTIIS